MSQRQLAFALLFIMPLFYASNSIFGRVAVADLAPFTLAFLRWFIALVIMLVIVGRKRPQLAGLARQHWRALAMLGLLGMLICGGIFYYALKFTTATNAILIYVSAGLMIVTLEYGVMGRPVRGAELAGVVIGFVGVGYIVFAGDISRLQQFEFGFGEAIVVGCALSWAVYSLVLRQRGLRAMDGLTLFTLTTLAGTVVLAPFAAIELALFGGFPAAIQHWQSILGLAVISSVIPFWIFQFGVRTVGPTLTGVFLNLLPVYGIMLAMIFLGETLQAYHVWGTVIIMSGVLMATVPLRGRRAQAKSDGL